jgi:predicted NBD/HSP70 family sugar kinase
MKRSDLTNFVKLIYAEGHVSRAGLAEKTGLAHSYITTIVRDLQNADLLLEKGRAPSDGGRRRVLLTINPKLAHLIGIEIGTANCRVVATDLLGNVMNLKRFPSENARGKDHVLENIYHEIERLVAHDDAIKGIGMSQSGVIDRRTGTVLFWPKVQGWNNVPLKQMLETKYHLPVVVEDSVRTMAVAERRFGRAKDCDDVVYVNVGMGIGSAIFVNGRLHFGYNGMAGELGHTTIDESGDLCSCGNRGCLEVYASGSAIINRVRSGLEKGVTSSLLEGWQKRPAQLSVETIVEAARGHDRLSGMILSEAGVHLGTALATIVNLLNPKRIILGGAVPQAAKGLLLKPLLDSLRARAFHRSMTGLEVLVSRLGDESAALGAVILVAEQILEELV